jgi:hypothetical protein
MVWVLAMYVSQSATQTSNTHHDVDVTELLSVMPTTGKRPERACLHTHEGYMWRTTDRPTVPVLSYRDNSDVHWETGTQ